MEITLLFRGFLLYGASVFVLSFRENDAKTWLFLSASP